MKLRDKSIAPAGKGDEAICEDSNYRFEDWTNLPENAHVMLRIEDGEGGYYFRTFSQKRAKDEGWLHVEKEERP